MFKATINSIYLSELKYKQRWTKAYILLLAIAISLSAYGVSAQASKNLTIDRDMIDQPLTIEGISGGTTSAQEITQTENTATGYCDGYVQPQPNHLLKLESFFEFLRLEVRSPVDTTILIKGPGGVWCNDDAGTANPMIEGQWQPGIYQVWIGSYQADSNNEYEIKIRAK